MAGSRVHCYLHETTISPPYGPGSPVIPLYCDIDFIVNTFMVLWVEELRSIYEYICIYLDSWDIYFPL